jgi:hypothetical protein
MKRRRRRYAAGSPPDLWADLGPGDPGYRLRPGMTGFDPVDTYAEYGRVIGLLLKGAVTGRVGPFPKAALFVLAGMLLIFLPSFMGSLDVAVGRSRFWIEVTYATMGGICGLLIWVGARALYRALHDLWP